MDLPTRHQEVIEITDGSDDDPDVRPEDFMTAEELNAVLRGPHGDGPDLVHGRPHTNSDPRLTEVTTTPVVMSYESCLEEILEFFPGVSRDHVKKLYDEHPSVRTVARGTSLAEDLIFKICDDKNYPKERDRLNDLKRKRISEANSDDERAMEWKNAERIDGGSLYSMQARNLLQEDFPDIPQKFIELKFKELGYLYATYLALDIAEATYETSAPRPYIKLKKKRRPCNSTLLTRDEMSPLSNAYQNLKEELGAAQTQRKKLLSQREIEKAIADGEAAEEKALRDSGQVMECACCFDDDVPINKITWCSADTPHAFCFGCAATNANTQIGLSRSALTCMDGSSCKEIFSRSERQRFLDPKTVDKLERLQQQAELRDADLENLETCPFCDFAAVCDPIEVDKEFRCGNPECEKVSCRKCRNVTHIPMSCEEFKRENGVSERHQIEEARTQALLRQCPKCKSSVFKDGGCNKIMCPCGGAICDYCGKDITKERYNHFRDGPPSTGTPALRGKCPTHDNDYERNQQNMEKAEKETMDKIRKENPELSEEDLRIKFRENVKTPPRNPRYPYMPPGAPEHLQRLQEQVLAQRNALMQNRDAMVEQREAIMQNRRPPPGLPDPPQFAAHALAGYYIPPHPHYFPPPPHVHHPNVIAPHNTPELHHPYFDHAPPARAERRNAIAPPPIDFPVPQLPRFDFDQAARDSGIAPPRPRPRRAGQSPARDLDEFEEDFGDYHDWDNDPREPR